MPDDQHRRRFDRDSVLVFLLAILMVFVLTFVGVRLMILLRAV